MLALLRKKKEPFGSKKRIFFSSIFEVFFCPDIKRYGCDMVH